MFFPSSEQLVRMMVQIIRTGIYLVICIVDILRLGQSQMTLFAPFFSVQTTHMYFYVVGMYDDIYS